MAKQFRQPYKRRPYRHIERRYIVEYVVNRFKNRVYTVFNMRLGPPREELRKRYPQLPQSWFKVWMPMADAVVVTNDAVYIIEAKIRYPRQAIGQLLDYKLRAYNTPELKRFLDRPVIPVLVTPLYDPEIEETCRLHGIVYDVYTPPWVIEYMREVKLIP